MESIDYKKLYKLQDKVLDVVFDADHAFYLTGGTAINRFYKEIRYSEDLDFFNNDNDNYVYDLKAILEQFEKTGLDYTVNVSSRDFHRVFIGDLKVEFINDRVKYFDRPKKINKIRIDNLKNIYINKITALISRDEPKDVVDIWTIDTFFDFDIKEILALSQEKMYFDYEDFIYRLKTFPKSLIEKIDFADTVYKNKFLNSYDKMCDRFEMEIKNG